MDFAFFKGFATSGGLIVAIGAQNAFVLRQGIKREHVLAVVMVCALSDALLITLGVAGLGSIVQRSPTLLTIARYGGAAFLIAYGLFAARRALRTESMTAAADTPLGLRTAIVACLAFTYLNLHCWLDTVVLLGSIASQQPDGSRALFGIGAISASFVWFFALGFGARVLRGVFARAVAWKILDAGIALVMWAIAGSLLVGQRVESPTACDALKTPPAGTKAYPGSMLVPFGPDLYLADGPTVSLDGFPYPTRMAIARLSTGNVWIGSPIALTKALADAELP